MERGHHAGAAEAGFSLVEVLIAVAILGIVALGIVGLFSHSIVVNASGYDYAVLSGVARQSLEQLQSLPFLDPQLAATGGTPRVWPDPTGTGRFAITLTVTDYGVTGWTDVGAEPPTAPPDPTAWPAPAALRPNNLKRITLGVSSTNEGMQGRGRRQFVVSALKIP